MLREQLIAAIGKTVTPDDFAEYMRFHNNKLFNPQYKPKPYCYSIRRTNEHSPQGVVSIERKPGHGDAIAEPISTIVHHAEASAEMKVRLSASTEIGFGGDRFVHGISLPCISYTERAVLSPVYVFRFPLSQVLRAEGTEAGLHCTCSPILLIRGASGSDIWCAECLVLSWSAL